MFACLAVHQGECLDAVHAPGPCRGPAGLPAPIGSLLPPRPALFSLSAVLPCAHSSTSSCNPLPASPPGPQVNTQYAAMADSEERATMGQVLNQLNTMADRLAVAATRRPLPHLEVPVSAVDVAPYVPPEQVGTGLATL